MRLNNSMHTRLSIVVLAFVLNLVWENAQAPLFNGYQNFVQHFMPCLWATIGDAVIILLFYEAYAFWCKDRYWIAHMKGGHIVTLMIMGVILAIFMEWGALVSGRWSYAESMPTIPLLGVGLLPVLQMMFLPLMTFCGIAKFNKN
ncbi:MAG: hypothetical protein HZA35_01810 [Parcubacteria group bacterium]|nr:hypothetical protein [Parcubacteria group bacterium]